MIWEKINLDISWGIFIFVCWDRDIRKLGIIDLT